MKKKIIIALVAILVTVGFVFLWQDYQKQLQEEKAKDELKASGGCHVVDGKLYANFSGLCYVFDDDTDELVMESALALNGGQNEENIFEGTLAVMDFQHAEKGEITTNPVVEQKAGGFYIINDLSTCRHQEKNENGVMVWKEHFTDYSFTYYLYPKNPQFLAVVIYEHRRDNYHVAVVADSEPEARVQYKWFKENEPSLS